MSYLSQALEAQAVSQQKATGRSIERIFQHALEEINRGYKAGTISYIKATYPQLWEKIVSAEDKLNEAWLAGEGQNFNEALGEWRDLHQQAIDIMRKYENVALIKV